MKRRWLVLLAAGVFACGWFVETARAQVGGILREVYQGIEGSSLFFLTNAPIYPDNPTLTEVLTNEFETPSGFDDNYGQRVRGFILPPATGNYVFWISSDDNSALYLSPDANASNKVLIARVTGYTSAREWDKEPNQQSAPVALQVGRIYYIEALMKEGTGGDNLAVRWQLPDGTIEEPIPASRLLPAAATAMIPTIAMQPFDTTVPEGGLAMFRVAVRNMDRVYYQWQRNGADIRGATTSVYTIPAVAVNDNGARFACVITNSLGSTKSSEAVLHVIADREPPTVATVANAGFTTLRVTFSEPVYKADVASNFSLNNKTAVLSATATSDPKTVVLTTTTLAIRTEYELRVVNVTDRSAARNPVAPNTVTIFVTAEFAPVDIGSPQIGGSMTPVSTGLDITASGRGVSGTNDQFLFSYQVRSNDFDIKVRIASLSPANPWAHVGLMARQNLTPSSQFAAVFATPSVSGCYFQYRTTPTNAAIITGNAPVNSPSTWIRLQRRGNQFSGYASLDGEGWSYLGTAEVKITNDFYFGIAASSHATNLVTIAEVREVNNVAGTPALTRMNDGLEPLGPSSRRTALTISEIMYHPLPRTDSRQLEFIEIFNSGATAVSLGHFYVDGAIDYEFSSHTTLPAGAFLVVAKNPADIKAFYGITNVVGPYQNRLENGTGEIRLRNSLGAILLQARYSGDEPWPVAADGAGHSLVLARPSRGEGNLQAWAPSHTVGGSPGRYDVRSLDRLDNVRINEFLAHSSPPQSDFIELFNHSNEAVDLSGCVLTDNPHLPKFVIGSGTLIGPMGFLAFYTNQLGFGLNTEGESVFLMNPLRTRILEGIRFGPQALGISSGRYPDGTDRIQELQSITPGKSNTNVLTRDIVINEIMYHAITNSDDAEFVELHNKGRQPVDLGGWAFTDGIQFTFPPGTIIRSQGYVVVARNAAYLLQNYTNLDSTVVVGDYQGSLSHVGERIALGMPQLSMVTNANGTVVTVTSYVTVDEVTYAEGGRWGQWSDGGGSSLELIDTRSDNRLASNWGDSDENAKSAWIQVERTGVLSHGNDVYGIDLLQILLMEAGECLVDNVELYGPSGENLVVNSTFEGGFSDLVVHGNHKRSSLEKTGGINNSRCLRVKATGRGDPGPNEVSIPLKASLADGTLVTIRARVRWLRGNPEILFRVRGNYLEASGRMALPANLGTPGAKNSRAKSNVGPAIYEVAHFPVLPKSFESVLVTAQISDPDGLASVYLNYRFDPSVTVIPLKMLDDGKGGDLIPGDGIYSAMIPGQASNTLIAFAIEAKDRYMPVATSTFPNDAPARECLVRFGETQPSGSFGAYRIWFTQAVLDEWSDREPGSNDPLDATFVYGDARVIYNMQTMYSGSPWHWQGYDSPMGSMCAYVMMMPADDLFLGTSDFVLNAPSNMGSDSTAIRERTVHQMAEKLGLPSTYRRFVHLYINGLRRSTIFEDAQQPNRELVEEWYPADAEGELFKIEDWFEYGYGTNTTSFSNHDATLSDAVGSDGRKKQEFYRWMWRKRAVRDSAHDYESLFELVSAVNVTDPDAFTQAVESVVDIEQWLRTMAIRHAVCDWDSFGYQRGKNMYAYTASNLKWVLLNWDIAFALGLGDGVTKNIFDNVMMYSGQIDPIIDRLFTHPPFRRLYLQAFRDIINGPFRKGTMDNYISQEWTSLRDNGINVSGYTGILSWIDQRRSYIETVLATNDSFFSATVDLAYAEKNLVLLQGTAPLSAKTIEVNGMIYPIQWQTVTNWTMRVPVYNGQNELAIKAYDSSGFPLTKTFTNLQVAFNGPNETLEDRLIINEIMYHPAVDGTEYVEIHNTSTVYYYDLSGIELRGGVDFEFPEGTLIPPQGYLLVVEDIQTFKATYGEGYPIVGQFEGRLNNGGERLRLIDRSGATSSEEIVVCEVTYDSRAPWPIEADSSSASLQLIDPLQDTDRVGNWAAVDANGMALPRWQYVSLTGKPTGSRISLSLSAPGEVLIDRMTLVSGYFPEEGSNLILNGDFEQSLSPSWQAEGGHGASTNNGDLRLSGQSSLQLVCSDGTGSVFQDISPALTQNQFYTLSFWYRPRVGDVTATVKIDGLGLTWEQSTQLEPRAPMSPGAPNSVRTSLGGIPTLWINEALPINSSGIVDKSGTREPWIELYYSGNRSLSLDDFYLSDDMEHLMKWSFPKGSVVNPGQFIVVWTDGQPEQTDAAEWHTSFRLTPTNGLVLLTRMQNGLLRVVDSLRYSNPASGQSIGALPDGNQHGKQSLSVPTPRASNANQPAVPAIRINEWMASNTATLADSVDGDFEDWFELYNSGTVPVDLSGYTLTDNLTNTNKWTVPNGTSIAPKGYLLVWADEETEQNGTDSDLHVNFKLSRGGEEIGLFDSRGNRVDAVSFGPQTDDKSEGRLPDGSATITRLAQATPRASNGGVVPDKEIRISSIGLLGAQVTLKFESDIGKQYQVQFKDDLNQAGWNNLGLAITATALTTQVVDQLPPQINRRYYRVVRP